MRVDVDPIVTQANRLIASISAKSKSRSAQEAHTLLTIMPSPCWAETAPGCTIYYDNEQNVARCIELLRYSVLTWLRALIDPSKDWEPTAEWPQPENLVVATRELALHSTSLEGVHFEKYGSVPVEV